MKWCSTWLTREIQIKTTMKYHPTLVRIVVLVLVTQLCLTLCNSTDYSPPGSSVCWILQTRILKWVATPFSRGSSQPRVSCITGRLHYITLSHELQRSPTCHDGSHQKATYNKYWWGCGERQPSYSVGRNVNWYSHYGKREQFSQKRKKKRNKTTIWSSSFTFGYIFEENKTLLKYYIHHNVHSNIIYNSNLTIHQ